MPIDLAPLSLKLVLGGFGLVLGYFGLVSSA